MIKLFITFFLILSISTSSLAQTPLDSIIPLRGFCIAAPSPKDFDVFVRFVEKELAPRSVNTLILRVDYNFQFKSHPELRDSSALSLQQVKSLVKLCQRLSIELIPQINLLGHQSWASKTNNLLRVYPQFDETPSIKMPEKYVWPNADGLYCKSYCPLHPEVHKVVFDLVDEICDAFEAKSFHAGMDEVFYIGDDRCPRCSGMDKAELFAREVNTIASHLALQKRKLWIWGDRLIDGATTGIGMWEASMNNTHRAIDLISKNVMICDWHYERADKTAVYFAMKGFDVATCPWRNPQVAINQLHDIISFRESSNNKMREKFRGMVQTVWSDPKTFIDEFNAKGNGIDSNSAANCFRRLFDEIKKLN